GFQKDSNEKEYLRHLENKSLLEILNVEKVQKGDVFFIPTGRIHAIGAGVLLAEIQQTSDITYRVYDWDRRDAAGRSRALHTDLALQAIDYTAQDHYHTKYSKQTNQQSTIIDCQYFTTNNFPVKGKIKIRHTDKDSFIIYVCVDGYGSINGIDFKKGETVLIPAILKELFFESMEGAELLEVYIK
ncbi:MAG: class I mannose-6-phosphate isomerase, partial [Flavobacteriaceae bacterium]|nr:class I mannose-6-phosphate isomerase [Flavobacteriaceae bacterium]